MKETFKARLYAPGSSTAETVQIKIGADSLDIVGTNESLPLAGFTLRFAGHDEDRIRLTDSESGLTLMCEDHDILDALAATEVDGQVRRHIEEVRRKAKTLPLMKRTYWLRVGAPLVLVAAFLFVAFDGVTELAVQRIDPKMESEIGGSLIDEDKLDQKSDAFKRVETIGAKLLAKLKDNPYKFQFFVKKDTTVNACAYPGGYLVVNTALIKEAKSDGEIAGIVGHEIGHVLHRDTLRALVRKAGLWAGLRLITGFGGSKTAPTAEALNALRVLEGQRFSRVQEADADVTGVDLSYEAGYNPEELIAFFTRLSKAKGHSDNRLLALLSDHPMDSERIEAIRAEVERLKQDKVTE